MYIREFLNIGPGTALIEAEVIRRDSSNTIDATVSISDCNRMIHLEFNINNDNWEEGVREKDYKNALYKIDTLITTLVSFKGELLNAYQKQEEV